MNCATSIGFVHRGEVRQRFVLESARRVGLLRVCVSLRAFHGIASNGPRRDACRLEDVTVIVCDDFQPSPGQTINTRRLETAATAGHATGSIGMNMGNYRIDSRFFLWAFGGLLCTGLRV